MNTELNNQSYLYFAVQCVHVFITYRN